MVNIFEKIQNSITEWENFTKNEFGDSVELISISRYDENRRTYKSDRRIIKVQKIAENTKTRANNLEGEYNILNELQGVEGICKNAEFHRRPTWEYLSYDFADGQSLENLFPIKDFKRDNHILREIYRIVKNFNKRGIAHRDLNPNNIIINNKGNIFIIDFDQAIRTNLIQAYLIDVFGIGLNKKNTHFCFENLVENFIVDKPVWSKPVFFLFKAFRKINKILTEKTNTPRNDTLIDEDLKNLQEAWKIAEKADANSPGGNISYYSLGIDNLHLDGERPWILRWTKISKKVDFKGKKLLECGCNLGLLSAFAKKSGAENCLGVDWNADILSGARLVSKALHVENTFTQTDFDQEKNLDQKFQGFDIVTALSLVNWIKDKEKFLSFLGKHNEVIYEGHDSVEIETKRLKQAGFNTVDLIFMSERNRPTFHAYK